MEEALVGGTLGVEGASTTKVAPDRTAQRDHLMIALVQRPVISHMQEVNRLPLSPQASAKAAATPAMHVRRVGPLPHSVEIAAKRAHIPSVSPT